MAAPERFVAWMSAHVANDKKFGRKVFRYHPRSDEHSKKICALVLEDLLVRCPPLAEHAKARVIVGGINTSCTFASGKCKTIDLAIGLPASGSARGLINNLPLWPGEVARLRLGCEAKQCMTEHSKTKPRIFDELSSSHEIVHQGQPDAIAAGIVVVNIAKTFASPLRQLSGEGPLIVSNHKQPDVTKSMVNHLRGLKMRDRVGDVGFDAFATIVVDCDNLGPATLYIGPPAPQPGDRDHYDTFLDRISRAYAERFGG